MVKSDNLAPQKARLNFHQGILNSMLFNLFRPMESATDNKWVTPPPPPPPQDDLAENWHLVGISHFSLTTNNC